MEGNFKISLKIVFILAHLSPSPQILPRMLVDTNQRSTVTKLFGHELSAPIALSPIGINKVGSILLVL